MTTCEEWTLKGLITEIKRLHDHMPDRALALVLGLGPLSVPVFLPVVIWPPLGSRRFMPSVV